MKRYINNNMSISEKKKEIYVMEDFSETDEKMKFEKIDGEYVDFKVDWVGKEVDFLKVFSFKLWK